MLCCETLRVPPERFRAHWSSHQRNDQKQHPDKPAHLSIDATRPTKNTTKLILFQSSSNGFSKRCQLRGKQQVLLQMEIQSPHYLPNQVHNWQEYTTEKWSILLLVKQTHLPSRWYHPQRREWRCTFQTSGWNLNKMQDTINVNRKNYKQNYPLLHRIWNKKTSKQSSEQKSKYHGTLQQRPSNYASIGFLTFITKVENI